VETVAAGGFFILFGLVFVLIGSLASARDRAYRRRAERVPGVVIDLRGHWTSGSGSQTGGYTAYHPVLEFRLLDGRPARVESFRGTNPPKVRPGQSVTVLYDPDDPGRASVDDGSRRMYWLMVGAGAFFVLFGVLLLAFG
jgi:hypothetical protein